MYLAMCVIVCIIIIITNYLISGWSLGGHIQSFNNMHEHIIHVACPINNNICSGHCVEGATVL